MDDIAKKLAALNGLTQADMEPKPQPEERLGQVEQRQDALETTTDDIILMMADLIGGD